MAPNPYFYSTSDLIGVLSGLGLELSDLVAAATSRSAKAINRSESIGSLSLGRRANIAVFDIDTEQRTWHGAYDQTLMSEFRLRPRHTIVSGDVIWSA